jgi:hypothetical protein
VTIKGSSAQLPARGWLLVVGPAVVVVASVEDVVSADEVVVDEGMVVSTALVVGATVVVLASVCSGDPHAPTSTTKANPIFLIGLS